MRPKLLIIPITMLIVGAFALMLLIPSNKVRQTFEFPTGYGNEVIILNCFGEHPLSVETARDVYTIYDKGVEEIGKSTGQKMHDAMIYANENGTLPNFNGIEDEAVSQQNSIINHIKEKYHCSIDRKTS